MEKESTARLLALAVCSYEHFFGARRLALSRWSLSALPCGCVDKALKRSPPLRAVNLITLLSRCSLNQQGHISPGVQQRRVTDKHENTLQAYAIFLRISFRLVRTPQHGCEVVPYAVISDCTVIQGRCKSCKPQSLRKFSGKPHGCIVTQLDPP